MDDGIVVNVCHTDLVIGIITIDGVSYLILVTQKAKVAEIEGKSIYCIKGVKFLSFKSDRYVVCCYSWTGLSVVVVGCGWLLVMVVGCQFWFG